MDCTFGGAVHWDNALIPLDSSDANGTSFAFTTSTCTDDATTTILATDIENLTLIFSFGSCIIAALVSALFVAKLWK